MNNLTVGPSSVIVIGAQCDLLPAHCFWRRSPTWLYRKDQAPLFIVTEFMDFPARWKGEINFLMLSFRDAGGTMLWQPPKKGDQILIRGLQFQKMPNGQRPMLGVYADIHSVVLDVCVGCGFPTSRQSHPETCFITHEFVKP